MPGNGGSKGGRGLELSLQMWVNSVLPADMSLKKLDDALAAPLVVPLFVQVLRAHDTQTQNHQSSDAKSPNSILGVRI